MMDICHVCFIHLLYVLLLSRRHRGGPRLPREGAVPAGERCTAGGRAGVTEVSAFKSAVLQNTESLF